MSGNTIEEEERDQIDGLIDPKEFFETHFEDPDCYTPYIVTTSSEVSTSESDCGI